MIEFENQDGSPIDNAVFTYNNPVVNEFKTETYDILKEGSYSLRLKAFYFSYTNVFERLFTIDVVDTCKDALLTIDIPPFSTYYKIGTPAIVDSIDPSLILSSETDVTCSVIIIEVTQTDGSAIHGSVF